MIVANTLGQALLSGVRPQSKVASDCTLEPDPGAARSTLEPDPGAALWGQAQRGGGSGGLHCNFDGVLAGRVGDDGAVYRIAIEGDGLDALLSAVGMDGDVVLCLAELTVDGVVAGCLWQTGIDADTVVVGLDAEDEL